MSDSTAGLLASSIPVSGSAPPDERDPDELAEMRRDLGLPEDYVGQQVTADASVADKPFRFIEPEPECEHRTFRPSFTAVAIETEATEDTPAKIDHYEARFRVMCDECGTPFEIDPTGRLPRDGRPGITVVMKPADEWS